MVTHTVSQRTSCKERSKNRKKEVTVSQQAVLSKESNGVGMIDERMTSEQTSEGKRNNNLAEKDSGNKGRKEVTTKEYSNKNIIFGGLSLQNSPTDSGPTVQFKALSM